MNTELRGLPVVFFEESGVIIAYCVPLDVSSCGHDIEEAKHNIRDALTGFIEACEEMGTLDEVLEESGFQKHEGSWSPPVLINTDKFDLLVA
jgi:predicted RNase H-like HicB family nuclease